MYPGRFVVMCGETFKALRLIEEIVVFLWNWQRILGFETGVHGVYALERHDLASVLVPGAPEHGHERVGPRGILATAGVSGHPIKEPLVDCQHRGVDSGERALGNELHLAEQGSIELEPSNDEDDHYLCHRDGVVLSRPERYRYPVGSGELCIRWLFRFPLRPTTLRDQVSRQV